MDPQSYPVTPKRGGPGRRSGTYYVSGAQRNICRCVFLWFLFLFVVLIVLLALTTAYFLLFTGDTFSDRLHKTCTNGSDDSIDAFVNFTQKYAKVYQDEEICVRLDTFSKNLVKYSTNDNSTAEARFGITVFADWEDNERSNYTTRENGYDFDIVTHELLGSPSEQFPGSSWHEGKNALNITFDDSLSPKENLLSALKQWYENNKDRTSLKTDTNDMKLVLFKSYEHANYNSTGLLRFFKMYGVFAARIILPYDICDYTEGIITAEQCRNGEYTAIDGIVCGYGVISPGRYFWEVQPVGSAWRNWGLNGTLRVEANDSKGCWFEQGIFGLKPSNV